MCVVMSSNWTPTRLSRGFAAARPSQNEHGRAAAPPSPARPSPSPPKASRGDAHPRLASAIVHRRPRVAAAVLRGTKPLTSRPSKRRRRQLEAGGEAALREKEKASVRAKAEHPFFHVKRVFGYGKVRYRGLHKNAQRIALLLGFANLLIAERKLAA